MKRQIKCSECLNVQTVNFRVDRWSNVHNKPILWASVVTTTTKEKGDNYSVGTTDTQSDYTPDNSYIHCRVS